METKKKLRLEERTRLYKYYRLGMGVREIVRELGRAPSTISRELRRSATVRDRNSDYITQAHVADISAHQRRVAASKRMRLRCAEIQQYIEERLKEGLSPELAAGRWTLLHPDRKIGKEAVYQWILKERTDLHQYLLVASKSRRRRSHGRSRRFKQPAAPKVSIEQRPEAANQRLTIGHFESDSIVSKQSKAALQTIVDRKSRKVFLSKLENLESATNLRQLLERLKDVPVRHRHTCTQDNGPEHAQHKELAEQLKILVFFSHPYCSSERGSVENRNRAIRRFLPKGTDFEHIPADWIQFIEDQLNNRPMKRLGFRTPNEVWNAALAA